MRVFLQEAWGAAPSLHPAGCPPLIGGCLPRPAGVPGALQQVAPVGGSVPTTREEDLRWHALPQWHTRLLGRQWRPPRYDHVGTHRNRSFLDYVKVAFRLYQAGGPPAGPGTAEPLLRADDVANAKFAQAPKPRTLCHSPWRASVSRCFLESIFCGLERRFPTRLFLGGLVADRATVRSRDKRGGQEKSLVVTSGRVTTCDSGSVGSVTDEASFGPVRRWQLRSGHK